MPTERITMDGAPSCCALALALGLGHCVVFSLCSAEVTPPAWRAPRAQG